MQHWTLSIHEVLLVLMLAILVVAVGFAYSKHCEVESLKAKIEELIETKGRYEAHKKFVVEKEEAIKMSSETHLANTNQWMDIIKSFKDSLADSRVDSAEKEATCSKRLENLRQQFNSVQNNVTELVKMKERASMQAKYCNDQIEAYKTHLNEEKSKLAECKRQ